MPVLGVIGCGKMAMALLGGLTETDLVFDKILVNDIDQNQVDLFSHKFNALSTDSNLLVKSSDVILLAVKPAQVNEVITLTSSNWNSSKILISIAAGVSTVTIEAGLPAAVPVIRVMPNLPAVIGQGVSAICPGEYVEENHLALAKSILNAIGVCVEVSEKQMDAVTAISGSGPAYVFLVAEAMINAGIQIGLDAKISRELVVNTIKGSIAMLDDQDAHPAILRDQVSSPGGTTIAAVRQMEEDGIRKAFFNGIEKAYLRSIALGKPQK
ncbi:MAG: pyrroline-5-carboxylate reductase [Syntrophomonadaceae bacterium]|nr:pyrroline-5-carboxylate reductase [Syntrophomonadaceae bacterium]